MTELSVTVTVCVRDGKDWIDGCLEALSKQTHRPLEIIAVDDGSTDGSKETLLKWHNPGGEVPIRVFTQDALGLSAGRQLAVSEANGEWVAITDIDVRPEPDWIANLVAQAEPVSVNERVVAVTGRTIFMEGDDTVSHVRSVEIAQKYRSRPRRTSLANGPCSMFHKEALTNIGGFDPEWYHAEDMEVSLRLIDAGGTIVYAPEAIVSHVPEVGHKRFLAKRCRDARAHMRIVRHFPRRKRVGPGFDFIGSSTIVLTIFPLMLLSFSAGLPFAYRLLTSQGDADWQEIKTWKESQLLLVSVVLTTIHELALWRGPLGVVNRGAIKGSPARTLVAVTQVRILSLRWSYALWKGIFLGAIDALLGRNGHKSLF